MIPLSWFLIFAAALLCSFAFSQRYVWIDTLHLDDITGSDTIVWAADSTEFPMFGGQWSIDVRYDSLDADDATFSIGGDNQGVGWQAIDNDDLPFTLDVTSNTLSINGTNRTVACFYGYYYPFITIGIKVDPGTVTDGEIIWKWISNK